MSREAGHAANAGTAWDHTWIERPLAPVWEVRFSLPFNYAASKNHIYATTLRGHVYLRYETRLMRQAISRQARIALMGRRPAHNKLWIDLLVQKPDHRGDAVNVVDLVCDAVKDVADIDDRWFCIRRLDWQVVKADPQLIIGLSQESREDVRVCSYCGQIKSLDAFNRRKGAILGIDRVCRECRHEGSRLFRERRDAGDDGPEEAGAAVPRGAPPHGQPPALAAAAVESDAETTGGA